MKWLAAILVLFIASGLKAQQAMTWDEFVDFVSTDENVEAENWSDYIDGLYELHLQPIDINSATLEDLKQIPILSQRQAEDIRLYILQYGAMKTLGELLAITSIDADMRRILPLFLHAVPSQKEHRQLSLRDSHHDMLTRLDLPLYRRQGETDGTYKGSGVAHRFRYNYSLGKNVQAGFGFEKDACEPMTFAAGYDHWSGFALLKNMGLLRTAVVGDYRMGWGSGLLINNRFSMGKSAFSTSTPTGIIGHRSASESNFLRGGALTLGNAKVQGTAFFSCRLLDAYYNKEGQATSLYTAGLHRADNEIKLRHVQRQLMAGAHMAWRAGRALELGATAFSERYSLPFTRGDDAYKRFYPEGTDFWGASLDYNLRFGRFSFTGETATDGNGVATLNHLVWRKNRRLQLTASGRYYSPAFHSFMSGAFRESAVQNEHGCYLSVLAEPLDGLTLRAYADFFYRPHSIYLVGHSTQGQDVRLHAAYRLNGRNTVEARAQWKHKEVYYALYVSQKYSLIHTFEHGAWRLRTQAQVHHYSTASGVRNLGLSLQPTLRYQAGAWRAAMALAWFKTDDYYSRIYLSLPSLSGTQNTMFYGHGLSSAAIVRYGFKKKCFLTLRYAIAAYFDRTTISSGHQAIPSRYKNDISAQLQVKL